MDYLFLYCPSLLVLHQYYPYISISHLYLSKQEKADEARVELDKNMGEYGDAV